MNKKNLFSMYYFPEKSSQHTMKDLINKGKEEVTNILWQENPEIKELLSNSGDIEETRKAFLNYLKKQESKLCSNDSETPESQVPSSRKRVARDSIRIARNFIQAENEQLSNFSALKKLIQLARDTNHTEEVTKGFLTEFIYLFRSIKGCPTILDSGITDDKEQNSLEEYIRQRTKELNLYSNTIDTYTQRYRTGYEEEIISKRESLRQKILEYFNAGEAEWNDYQWHIEHIIEDRKTLSQLVKLEKDEEEGLKAAEEYDIPVQVTPYYVSLFNSEGRCEWDRAIRAQVIPSSYYCQKVYENQQKGGDMDFMGEKWTSPVETITRRYPQILILKPFDSCPQICVYCQRNWEIKKIKKAWVPQEKIDRAITWIKNNPAITEVLITGGDPLYLSNDRLDSLFKKISEIPHVQRIRIGTRILITVPQRIDETFLKILDKYHQPGRREICVVTHFEHSSEMTPFILDIIQKIRRLGISIYNQQVFTYYNSRRFETALLRKTLKISGIDPYYTFNTKGKEETLDYRVPIARLEQERNEEARILPGIERTDEAVFNVPRIGKSHLRGWQNHEPIMILANGARVYRFYPWESRLRSSDEYIYTDVSIYDYLFRLYKDGEEPDNYQSVWYYY